MLDLAPELEEVRPLLDAAWDRVVRSGHFILGHEVEQFEREVATFLNAKHAVGVNSGTDALVIALRALGIGPGDEVLTVSFTFFATAEAISSVGATPVFVDVDGGTLTLDPAGLARTVTARTKAIAPVHLYGQAAPMEELGNFARERGLAIVEDVAQAFGGMYDGRRLGTLGSAGAFSFFPSKNLGCLGDGGLVVTDDDRVAERARMLRAHGCRRKYHNETLGYNSRLDALQAALLRAKLPHVDRWNEQRRAAAGRYRELLRGVRGIELPVVRERATHVYHQFTIRVKDGRRDALKERLSQRGIDTMVYYPNPIHTMPMYHDRKHDLPETELASREVLSLPIWPAIRSTTQERIASEIARFIG